MVMAKKKFALALPACIHRNQRTGHRTEAIRNITMTTNVYRRSREADGEKMQILQLGTPRSRGLLLADIPHTTKEVPSSLAQCCEVHRSTGISPLEKEEG